MQSQIFEVDGVKSGEAEKDNICALQKFAKDWSSYNLTIYTYGSATNGTGGRGTMLTAGQPSNHAIHHSYAIPASTWCSSCQAKMGAMKKTLPTIQTEESLQKDWIVNNSQSVQQYIANLRPAITPKSIDESDILSLLAALHDEAQRITFTWCGSCER